MKCLIYVGKEFRKFVGLYGGSSLQETFRKCLENPKSVREMSGKCQKCLKSVRGELKKFPGCFLNIQSVWEVSGAVCVQEVYLS